jgi:hypothetical protein
VFGILNLKSLITPNLSRQRYVKSKTTFLQAFFTLDSILGTPKGWISTFGALQHCCHNNVSHTKHAAASFEI